MHVFYILYFSIKKQLWLKERLNGFAQDPNLTLLQDRSISVTEFAGGTSKIGLAFMFKVFNSD